MNFSLSGSTGDTITMLAWRIDEFQLSGLSLFHFCTLISHLRFFTASDSQLSWCLLALQRWIWNPTCSEQREDNHSESREDAKEDSEEQVIGFKVKNAVLSPDEVEKGVWPENYSLSDHARLTVVFSIVRMLCPVFKT